MMKKFVMLMVVLGMASLAQAGLQLSFNGQIDLLDSEIVILPSDLAWIDIYNDTDGAAGGAYDTTFVGITGLASWTGGNNVYSPPSPAPGSNYYLGPLDLGFGEMDYWMWSPAAATTPYSIGGVADFELHADDLGDVTITLVSESGGIIDTMVIHVPEPMTMVLLGLGGLFLRRRK
jgi:hypothetical protein